MDVVEPRGVMVGEWEAGKVEVRDADRGAVLVVCFDDDGGLQQGVEQGVWEDGLQDLSTSCQLREDEDE